MKLMHIQNPVALLFIANVVLGNDGAPAEFGRERKRLIELHLTHWCRQCVSSLAMCFIVGNVSHRWQCVSSLAMCFIVACVSSLPHPEPAQARYAHPLIGLSHLIHIRNPVPHVFLVLEGDNLFTCGPLICFMTHEHVALPYPKTSTYVSCEHVVPDCSRCTSWAVTHPYVGVFIAGPIQGEWFEGSHRCDMSISHVWHVSFTCVTWRVHTYYRVSVGGCSGSNAGWGVLWIMRKTSNFSSKACTFSPVPLTVLCGTEGM